MTPERLLNINRASYQPASLRPLYQCQICAIELLLPFFTVLEHPEIWSAYIDPLASKPVTMIIVFNQAIISADCYYRLLHLEFKLNIIPEFTLPKTVFAFVAEPTYVHRTV